MERSARLMKGLRFLPPDATTEEKIRRPTARDQRGTVVNSQQYRMRLCDIRRTLKAMMIARHLLTVCPHVLHCPTASRFRMPVLLARRWSG